MKDAVTYERIAAALSTDGSIWLESAFCKESHGGALLFSSPLEVVELSALSGLELFFRTLEKKLAEAKRWALEQTTKKQAILYEQLWPGVLRKQ